MTKYPMTEDLTLDIAPSFVIRAWAFVISTGLCSCTKGLLIESFPYGKSRPVAGTFSDAESAQRAHRREHGQHDRGGEDQVDPQLLPRHVPWKWWAKYQKFDEQNARVEVVDLFHFLISMAQVLGMSADDVFAAYVKKNEVNFKRQDSGYTQKDHDDSKHI
jgi:hypothetical protein